jgi:hypothetical protein
LKKNYIKSFLSALVIFLTIYEFISYIKYSTNNKDILIINKINEVKKSIPKSNKQKEVNFEEHFAFSKCLEKDILADCGNIKLKPTKVLGVSIRKEKIEEEQGYKIFYDLKNSNVIILIIYLFLIYTLARQIYLFYLVKQGNRLNEIDFHNAEWNINTAPMFGLLGTFFSIAILLSNSGNKDISTLLLGNFFDAVMTTIMGIIFYIINFKLKIDIYPLVKFNE